MTYDYEPEIDNTPNAEYCYDQISNAHDAWNEILNAIITVTAKRFITISKNDLAAIMEAVSDGMHEYVKYYVDALNENHDEDTSYTIPNFNKLVDDAFFAAKQIKEKASMEALERSIAKANLRPVLTNPATYEAL
jgi:hypothetical protein